VTLVAEAIRKERTGVHATVTIAMGGSALAWSHFNTERDEDRGRLARSAHAHFGDVLATVYPQAHLKHELDLFCRALWDASLESLAPVAVGGKPDAPAATFVIEGFVVHGGGSILFAPPGRGKS
jgi:hypothetical protein